MTIIFWCLGVCGCRILLYTDVYVYVYVEYYSYTGVYMYVGV